MAEEGEADMHALDPLVEGGVPFRKDDSFHIASVDAAVAFAEYVAYLVEEEECDTCNESVADDESVAVALFVGAADTD